MYQLFPTDTLRVIAQVAIGCAVWIFFALTMAKASRYPRSVQATVLLLGLSPQIIRYDLAILSESISISLATLLVVATVRVVRSKTTPNIVLWILIFISFGMTRPTHPIIFLTCFVVALFIFVANRGKKMMIATPVLAILLVFSFATVNNNRGISNLNFYTVLANQVFQDDARYVWFVEHGMPDIAGIRDIEGYDYSDDLDPALKDLIELPEGQAPPAIVRAGDIPLATWVRDHGWTTQAKWMLTHPSDVANIINLKVDAALSPVNDDFLPLENRQILARDLFSPWVLWATLGAGSLFLLLIQPATRKQGQAIALMAASTALIFVATVTTAGIEHERHATTVAVLVRVLAITAMILVLPKRFTKVPDAVDVPPAK